MSIWKLTLAQKVPSLGSESLHDCSPVPTLPNPNTQAPARVAATRTSNLTAISEALCAAFPSREDLDTIHKSGAGGVVVFNQVLSIPYSVLEQDGPQTAEYLFESPDPKTHPVLLARQMLVLGILLQYVHPGFSLATNGLSEQPRIIIKRLVDTAIGLVTTNDELLGTVESLECCLFEGLFQSNAGNLRRAWMAFRRAMVVGQLMGIHRSYNPQPLRVIEQGRTTYPQHLWYRIVYADRTLSIMLGLPQGSLDVSMASPAALAADTPAGRIERMHCVLSARILERNESDPSLEDYATTRELDLELRKAAKEMPAKWWLIPNLADGGTDIQAIFWNMVRFVCQLFHYNLVNQLHLPYLLRSNAPGADGVDSDTGRYQYSRAACVSASREMLSRFITYRTYNRIAFCCRTSDFCALMGSMTLLLAHLDAHRQQSCDSLLTHQRMSDRAMMEEVLENMEGINKLNMDALSGKSSELLRRIMDIEAEAADAYQRFSAEDGRRSGIADVTAREGEQKILRLCVPYFGIIRIAPEGGISKEPPQSQQPDAHLAPLGLEEDDTSETDATEVTPSTNARLPRDHGSVVNQDSSRPLAADSAPVSHYHNLWSAKSSQQFRPPTEPQPQPQPMLGEGFQTGAASSQNFQFAPQFPTVIDHTLQEQYPYPALTAGADDWAFQGVDLAFFDTLMKGAGYPGNGWQDWQ